MKRHTSVFGGSMDAFSVRFRSDGVALWEMVFFWFVLKTDNGGHMRPG